MRLPLNLAVIAIAISASLYAAPGPKTAKFQPWAPPCDQDFTLKVSVAPVDPQGDRETIGFVLDYKKKSAKGVATRIHTGQKTEFTQAACLKWRKAQWDRFGRILYEHNLTQRSNLACLNMASVQYQIGSEKKSTMICLGGAKEDVTTYNFKKFYSGGDFLIGR